MIPLDDARARLAGAVAPLSARELTLESARGLWISDDVTARADLPLRDVSSMDGYAVRHDDLCRGEPLRCSFEVAAGTAPPPLPPASVARIFTGATLPAGADAVVQQEVATVLADGAVRLPLVEKGTFIRRRGEVVRQGDLLVPKGSVLTPARIALAAGCGVRLVVAIPRPRVTIVVTGEELVSSGSEAGPGGTYDSNGPLLAALAHGAGLSLVDVLRVGDDLEATVGALHSAAPTSDLIVTSGGVSVGDHDVVPRAIESARGQVVFHRVAIRPGKPALAARLGASWLVGLPGNPVSVLAGWHLFAWPLARALAGDAEGLRPGTLQGVLRAPLCNAGKRTVLTPSLIEGGTSPVALTPLPWKGSHDLVAASRAEALVRVDPGVELLEGDLAPFYRL